MLSWPTRTRRDEACVLDVIEPGSDVVGKLVEAATVVATSSIAYTESRAALASRQAGEFAERYRLRAYDSVHLAAFAEVAHEAGVRDTRFSSFDDALNRAARSLSRTLARAR
jgi:predicted nucleic acid-binding protein